MQIFATFEQSVQVELAITRIEKIGITDIYAFPLDIGPGDMELFDTIHRSDGISLSNLGMVLAVFFSVICAARGFKLEWGPIIWGIIGALLGIVLGVIINLVFYKIRNKKQRLNGGKKSEVIIIIECDESDVRQVEKILWGHFALGLAKVK
jgi:hypothetical protein